MYNTLLSLSQSPPTSISGIAHWVIQYFDNLKPFLGWLNLPYGWGGGGGLWSVVKFMFPNWGDKIDSGTGLSYRPARLHRLVESIPWNRFLGSSNLFILPFLSLFGSNFFYVVKNNSEHRRYHNVFHTCESLLAWELEIGGRRRESG